MQHTIWLNKTVRVMGYLDVPHGSHQLSGQNGIVVGVNRRGLYRVEFEGKGIIAVPKWNLELVNG